MVVSSGDLISWWEIDLFLWMTRHPSNQPHKQNDLINHREFIATSIQTMPRPARKPKKFKQTEKTQTEEYVVDAPVMSTPLPTRQIIDTPASPALSAIQLEEEIAVYQDPESVSDEFGFHTVKGIKKIVATAIESDDDNSEVEQRPDSYPVDDEEDIYGQPIRTKETSPNPNEPETSPVKLAPLRPSKPVKKLRTSELLGLLPTRRKRHQPPRHQKKMPTMNISDMESDIEPPTKPKQVKKRRVPIADKENDTPEASDNEGEEDPEVEKRKKAVKAKFAEVDKWALAFETVDVSFSSQ